MTECLSLATSTAGLFLMFLGALSAVAVQSVWRFVIATVRLWRATRKR